MVTYYTALGRLVTKEDNGTRIPIVIIDNEEFHMSVDELIIWGSLHWNFLNKEDLEKEYDRRKRNAHIFNDNSFEQTLERLERRQLGRKCRYIRTDGKGMDKSIARAGDYLSVKALC